MFISIVISFLAAFCIYGLIKGNRIYTRINKEIEKVHQYNLECICQYKFNNIVNYDIIPSYNLAFHPKYFFRTMDYMYEKEGYKSPI